MPIISQSTYIYMLAIYSLYMFHNVKLFLLFINIATTDGIKHMLPSNTSMFSTVMKRSLVFLALE